MTTIDLSTPPPAPSGLLDALPRRVALTLPELRLVAEKAGGAPLPFDVREPLEGSAAPALEGRLGQSRGSAEQTAYLAAVSALPDPAGSLARRGLVAEDGSADEGLIGAVGLLATPALALDLDITAGGVQARAWHRQRGEAVATLATVDGIVFELAWFPTSLWPAELGRVAVVPEDVVLRDSTVPAFVDLPYELADAAGEAVRSARADLVPVLVGQHEGAVHDARGTAYAAADISGTLAGLAAETQGRLRAMVADVSESDTSVVGIVSWVLLADGWHALRPHQVGGEHRVEVRRVEPSDLPTDLAPVLAEVTA